MRIVGTQMTWIAILIYALVVNQSHISPCLLEYLFVSPLSFSFPPSPPSPPCPPPPPPPKKKKPLEKPHSSHTHPHRPSKKKKERALNALYGMPHPFFLYSQYYGGRSHTKHTHTNRDAKAPPSQHKSARSKPINIFLKKNSPSFASNTREG